MKFFPYCKHRTLIATSTVFAAILCGCEAPNDIAATEKNVTDPPAAVAVEDSSNSSSVSNKPVAAETSSTSIEARFLCWNLESEGSDPKVIAEQIGALGRYDVYAFTEVLPSAEKLFAEALGENYQLLISRSGYHDRLAIAFDIRKFELLKTFEIKEINFRNRYRSPLVVHLKEKLSGIEFFVMNNHLARGKGEVRETQADQLVEWGRKQLLPVIALGDYNLDYDFATKKGNSAFPRMMKDNVWKWVKPEEMIDSNWYDNPEDPDGEDDYPGSLLDFAFVLGPAKEWNASCKVIVRQGDFPDNETTSDHRPFELLITK